MSCTCQGCEKRFSTDLVVPDEIWLKISPKQSEAGLLCPNCICEAINKQKLGEVNATIYGTSGSDG